MYGIHRLRFETAPISRVLVRQYSSTTYTFYCTSAVVTVQVYHKPQTRLPYVALHQPRGEHRVWQEIESAVDRSGKILNSVKKTTFDPVIVSESLV